MPRNLITDMSTERGAAKRQIDKRRTAREEMQSERRGMWEGRAGMWAAAERGKNK